MKTGMEGRLVLAVAGVLMAGAAGAQGFGGGQVGGPGFGDHGLRWSGRSVGEGVRRAGGTIPRW